MFKHHFISGLITPAAIAIILHLTPPPDVLQVDNDGQVTINGCFFNNTMLGVYGRLQVFDDH